MVVGRDHGRWRDGNAEGQQVRGRRADPGESGLLLKEFAHSQIPQHSLSLSLSLSLSPSLCLPPSLCELSRYRSCRAGPPWFRAVTLSSVIFSLRFSPSTTCGKGGAWGGVGTCSPR